MPDQPLVDSLVQQGLALAATAGGELERSCWMVVHEHHHGVKPTEYDIREIDEMPDDGSTKGEATKGSGGGNGPPNGSGHAGDKSSLKEINAKKLLQITAQMDRAKKERAAAAQQLRENN